MKVDYNILANRYDQHRTGGGPYLDTLVGLASDSSAQRVLEIGPGTGNNTTVFRQAYPCDIIGVERSPGMLARAHDKGVQAHWTLGDGAALPLGAKTIDFIFGICVLHHFDDLLTLFRECRRVLNGGPAAFVTSPWDYIENHPMNEYFPSFAKVDKARFQPVEDVRKAFQEAGFNQVKSKRDKAAPSPIDRTYADRVAGHYISTFGLIPQKEFEPGIKRLYADIKAKGKLDRHIAWEAVTVWGRG